MFNDPPWELRRRESSAEPEIEDLAFIRQTISKAGTFTAISGLGLAVMGVIGLAAAYWAARQATSLEWLMIWLAAAAVASTVGLVSLHYKASRLNVPMWSGPGVRFVLSMSPPFIAAAVLTGVFFAQGSREFIPGTWLLLYGAGVLTAGSRSARPVLAMGAVFMALGIAALFGPTVLADWYLGLGFGIVHVLFGAFIARRYGG